MLQIGAVGNKDGFSAIILNELKEFGVKCRKEKKTKTIEDKSGHKRIFRTHLHLLELADVFVASGNVVQIPKFVADACNRVLEQVETEGIFRKAGSTIRQREIRVSLEAGLPLGKTHHVIDVANVIKFFFRELPEPLISCSLQDTLLRCLLVRDHSVKAILLTCLLLPALALNTLAFFMQFLRTVSASSRQNKMCAENLAIIFMPALMPFADISNQHFNNHVKVVQLLIENANSIGIIPHNIIDKLHINDGLTGIGDGTEATQKRKKKRRSDMFNGLRKIVGSALGSSENLENTPENKHATAHDLATCQMQKQQQTLTTPCIKSTKKRKFTEPVCAFSAKKKRDLLALLPSNSGGILPNTPLTKATKKSRLSLGGNRHNAKNASTIVNFVPSMERRWSIVGSGWPKRNKNSTETKSQHQSFESIQQDVNEWQDNNSNHATPFQMKRPKVEMNCSIMCDTSFLGKTPDTALIAAERTETELSSDTESVRISKTEYEAIKERVSAIETRISQEFKTVCNSLVHSENIVDSNLSGPERVQNKYEQMIVHTETLTSPGTEQLAQRLSRGLKIRRSVDQQIIRSPSARKIGTLRRRSQDKKRLSRNPTWHISSTSSDLGMLSILPQQKPHAILPMPPVSFYAKSNNLKRGRPNTVQTGLVQQQYTPIAENSWRVEPSNEGFDSNEQWTAGELFFKDAESLNMCISQKNHSLAESASKSKLNAMKQIDFDACTPIKTKRICTENADTNMNCTPMLPPKSLPRKMSSIRTPNTATTKTAISKVNQTMRNNGISTPTSEEGNGRASIVRLRSQNAGMVMAKARLFDGLGSNCVNNDALEDGKAQTERNVSHSQSTHSNYITNDKQWEKCKLQLPAPGRKCGSGSITKSTIDTEIHTSSVTKKKGIIITKSPAGSITKRRRLSIPMPAKLPSKHVLGAIVRDETLCDARVRVNRQLKTQFNEQHGKDSIASPRIQKIQKNANYKFS